MTPRPCLCLASSALLAFGLVRIPAAEAAPPVKVFILAGQSNIREVVLFPMNQQAEDLLMGAPSEVTAKQLRELHIKIRPSNPSEPAPPAG